MTNEIIVDVMPKGIVSAYVEAPFDKAKTELEENGYRIISLAENAQLRIQEGVNSQVSQSGNYVREGVLYVPNNGTFLTKKSLIMANAKEATQCHRDGKEFYLTPTQVEEGLADSVKLTPGSIPTNRFGDNEITVYAFGDNAKAYGEFLAQEAGIEEMPIWLANVSDKPFARQMWFGRLGDGNRSELYGNYRLLYFDLRVRGVRDSESTAKSASLDIKVQSALSEGRAFEFNGLMYVPTTGKGLSITQ